MLINLAKNIDVITTAGTRPEIIKLAEFARKIENKNHAYVYTGQHFSDNMKDIFLNELNTKFDFDLHCDTSEVGVMKKAMVKFFKSVNPSYVITYGDTNSSMATALAAKEVGSKLIHLEAGIRDLDSTVPEEIIRIYIDSIADYMIAPTELSKMFLKYEGRTKNVFVAGNLIVDVAKKLAKVSERYDAKVPKGKYLLLTMHRPENVDDLSKLKMLVAHLGKLKYKIVFPIHPRTKNNLIKNHIKLPPNVISMDPIGYVEFISLLKNSQLVLTDSGGVTEESIILGKPCVTLRHTTARWETILLKANILFGLDRTDSLNDVVQTMLQTEMPPHPYGDNVASKTVKLVNKITKLSI